MVRYGGFQTWEGSSFLRVSVNMKNGGMGLYIFAGNDLLDKSVDVEQVKERMG